MSASFIDLEEIAKNVKRSGLYSVSEASRMLGVNRTTMYTFFKRYGIKTRRFGKLAYISGNDILTILNGGQSE